MESVQKNGRRVKGLECFTFGSGIVSKTIVGLRLFVAVCVEGVLLNPLVACHGLGSFSIMNEV